MDVGGGMDICGPCSVLFELYICSLFFHGGHTSDNHNRRGAGDPLKWAKGRTIEILALFGKSVRSVVQVREIVICGVEGK